MKENVINVNYNRQGYEFKFVNTDLDFRVGLYLFDITHSYDEFVNALNEHKINYSVKKVNFC